MHWSIALALVAGAISFTVYKAQGYMIYPSSFPEGSRTLVDTPDTYDMLFEDVYIHTSDNEKLHAFLLVHKGASAKPKTILMLGPNAGNMGHSLPLAQLFFDKMGYNVLMVSYRGYGKSSGKPSERGIKKDADAVLEYIASTEAIKDSSIVLYGRSLGGAVAIYTASHPLGRKIISGMILENTFLSIAKLVPSVMPIARPLTFLLTERWESEKSILDISPDLPCLFLAGGSDELIPPSHFKELFQICPSKFKTFKIYPKGTHNDTVVQEGYWQDVHKFILEKVPPPEA